MVRTSKQRAMMTLTLQAYKSGNFFA